MASFNRKKVEMKILLIGKNGQLGQSFLNQIKNFDIKIYAFSKEQLDITSFSAIKKKVNQLKPNIIVNTAAYHLLSDCEENPLKAFEINAVAVKNLAFICKEKDITLVTFSSELVFDGQKGKPYLENDFPNPLMIYGSSKMSGEQLALN